VLPIHCPVVAVRATTTNENSASPDNKFTRIDVCCNKIKSYVWIFNRCSLIPCIRNWLANSSPLPNTTTQSNTATSLFLGCHNPIHSANYSQHDEEQKSFLGRPLIHSIYLASATTQPESHRYSAYHAVSAQCFEHSLPFYSLDVLLNKQNTKKSDIHRTVHRDIFL